MLGIKVASHHSLRLRQAAPRPAPAESAEPTADVWAGPPIELRLVYDTRDQALPQGVRLVAQRARRVLFEAAGFELPLQVSAGLRTDRIAVIGQVLANGAPVARAAVQVDGPERSEAATDGDGSFRLAEILTGLYRLKVAALGQVLVTQSLELAGGSAA